MPSAPSTSPHERFWQLFELLVAEQAATLSRGKSAVIQVELRGSGRSSYRYLDVRSDGARVVEGICASPQAWLEVEPQGVEQVLAGDRQAGKHMVLLGNVALGRGVLKALDRSSVDWSSTRERA
jgi:hypothetical protein